MENEDFTYEDYLLEAEQYHEQQLEYQRDVESLYDHPGWDDSYYDQYDDDPNPYLGTYSEE